MYLLERFGGVSVPEGFCWLNEPARYKVGAGLEIWTDAETDFWQRTHYGFRRDDGHCLLARLDGDFCLSTHVEFRPQTQYDQCGLMVRVDAENWIKVSTEYESEEQSRLGSVVTTLGYSDWATQDVPSGEWGEMRYRISRNGAVEKILDLSAPRINTADLEYIQKRGLLVIPTFMNDRVLIYRVKSN